MKMMVKNLWPILVLALFVGCEKAGDCVKSTGPIQSKNYENLSFTKVLVGKGISVVLREGPQCNVEVRAGENLVNDIEVTNSGGMLRVADNTTCNWTREYGATVVYVTAPNLTNIISKTEKTIISEGVLHYPQLRLTSMDAYDGFVGVGTGDFLLELETQQLTVESNTVSRYFITGSALGLDVNFYESGGVFHGENFVADNIHLYHRGTNDMALHPIRSIKGDIYNIGNVICLERPETVEVSQHYNGRLIFY